MTEEKEKATQKFKISESSVKDSLIGGQANNDLYANQIQGTSNNIVQIIQTLSKIIY